MHEASGAIMGVTQLARTPRVVYVCTRPRKLALFQPAAALGTRLGLAWPVSWSRRLNIHIPFYLCKDDYAILCLRPRPERATASPESVSTQSKDRVKICISIDMLVRRR